MLVVMVRVRARVRAVFTYSVRAVKDGRCTHVGHFKSKLKAAVAFSEHARGRVRPRVSEQRGAVTKVDA